MSTNIYRALASALLQDQALDNSNAAAVSVSSKPMVLLNAFPVILDQKDYANALSTANPKGDLRSLWRFRQLVDPLPQYSQFYTPGSLSTESTYRQIVQGAAVNGDNEFVAGVVTNAKRIIQDNTYSDMDGTPGAWNPVYAVPDDWYDTSQFDRYQDLTVELNESTENNLGTGFESGNKGGLAEWNIGNPIESLNPVALDPGSKINSIQMKYLLVTINRPWLDALLFNIDGWYLSGQQKGFCSSGQNDGGGVMPLLPTGLIVGTNVKIDADWSPKDKQILDNAKLNQKQLSMGPLLVNPGFQNLHLHVIGWTVAIIPFSPKVSKEKTGSFLVKNSGGFTARFSVLYEQNGKLISIESGNFPVLAAKNIDIPPEASNISVKIEIMTSLAPETWSTVAAYNFDKPPTKGYELFGTTFSPQLKEIKS
jgi:hypothetical protein